MTASAEGPKSAGVEERRHLLARIQDEAIAAAAAAGHTGSAVEDLLVDRRAAAARENAEGLGPPVR